jgi:hypothetical protein
MPIPLTPAQALLYERLKSHEAGAAVRAATGPGDAGGVIPAHRLKLTPRPTPPFLAGRAGVIGGQSGDMRGAVLTWWIYDGPGEGYVRIDVLIDLVIAAYPERALDWGKTRVTLIGQQGEDSSLGGLLMRSIQLTYTRRG